MNISSKIEGDNVILSIDGSIDMFNSKSLKSYIEEAMSKAKFFLILDMTNVQSVDSSGLAILIQSNKMLKENYKRMVLIHIRPEIKDVLDLTRMSSYLEIYKDMEDFEANK